MVFLEGDGHIEEERGIVEEVFGEVEESEVDAHELFGHLERGLEGTLNQALHLELLLLQLGVDEEFFIERAEDVFDEREDALVLHLHLGNRLLVDESGGEVDLVELVHDEEDLLELRCVEVLDYEVLQVFAAFVQDLEDEQLLVWVLQDDAICDVKYQIVDVGNEAGESLLSKELEDGQ